MNKKLSVSLMCADLMHMADDVETLEANHVDWFHIDIMDAHFVPNLTFGPDYCKALKAISHTPLDYHLMMDNPELFINAVKNAVPEDYPDITIGEAYDDYFSAPEWSAFEGASSYYDDTIEYVVEFKGGCIYKEAEAEALIQFTFDPEFEGFEATYFALDGEPMEFRDLNAVSEIAFYQLSQEKAG